ncbi:copper amine oxidase N-terminal domain-containing protein [Fodinisporobacter ferrooxydans]|uniref:copper amine oxidase N-terminal domain-containing protein n=1 Tax=Fodinisporobacter ferrooxydans TaxID=2901836 RepID=UPI003D321DAB
MGSQTAAVNGKSVSLDAAPQIFNGSTYIPLRFVAESLGKSVTWDAANDAVELN